MSGRMIGCADGSRTGKSHKTVSPVIVPAARNGGGDRRRVALTHPMRAANGIRTRDPLLTRQILYRLSYRGGSGIGANCPHSDPIVFRPG